MNNKHYELRKENSLHSSKQNILKNIAGIQQISHQIIPKKKHLIINRPLPKLNSEGNEK
jgi:hypothetical protein